MYNIHCTFRGSGIYDKNGIGETYSLTTLYNDIWHTVACTSPRLSRICSVDTQFYTCTGSVHGRPWIQLALLSRGVATNLQPLSNRNRSATSGRLGSSHVTQILACNTTRLTCWYKASCKKDNSVK